MNVAARGESLCSLVKGEVVILRRLRKEFGIDEGTRAFVDSTSGGILIKPEWPGPSVGSISFMARAVLLLSLHGLMKFDELDRAWTEIQIEKSSVAVGLAGAPFGR